MDIAGWNGMGRDGTGCHCRGGVTLFWIYAAIFLAVSSVDDASSVKQLRSVEQGLT